MSSKLCNLIRRITKTYSVAGETEAPYSIDLTIQIEGDSRGLWLTTGIPEVEWISGSSAPALKYRITRHQKSEVENLDLPKTQTNVSSTYPDWISNSNGFLGMILDPVNETAQGFRAAQVPGTIAPTRLVEIDQEYHRFNAEDLPGYIMMLPLKDTSGSMHYRVFAGPFSTNVLKKVDSVYANPATGYNPDYIAAQSFHGWFAFISEPFAKILFFLMNVFHNLTGSWALSIILLTVALRIMLWPLNAWSTKSMARMQQIAPQVTAIQEKYKKDPKKVQLEIMNLYRESGVNPVSGCFPLLIQMPFLIGMFDLLKSTFELRGASFIPGWIDDLTAPDVLFSWNYPIFFIGTQFHLLPILLGLVMYAQQRFMSPLPKDPTQWTDQQRQQRFMGNVMAVVFMVMFYHFPSGLNIYWLSSMLLGMLQQYWTSKKFKRGVPQTAPVKGPRTARRPEIERMQAWIAFVDEQERELGQETTDKWLRTLKVAHFDACNLYLVAENSFHALWFEEHIRAKVLEKLYNNNKRPIKVHLSLVNAPQKPKNRTLSSKKPPTVDKPAFSAP